MTIELRQNEYVLGVWILEHSYGNVLTFVVKRGNDWIIQTRLRTYIDQKVFDSADPRQFHTYKLRGTPTEEEAIEAIRRFVQGASVIYPPVQPITETLVQSADWDTLIKAMESTPGLHTQKHTLQ